MGNTDPGFDLMYPSNSTTATWTPSNSNDGAAVNVSAYQYMDMQKWTLTPL
jgi:hypothetical protein